ncbi:MAG: hypothetical protein COA78_27450 [Blastopirellula sp.]|nr:MAG: hypothetical protein COA78_27450 [Blastopirellula sp.]
MSLEVNSDLLSAYLDGELNVSQRQEVEDALSKNPELQSQYHQLAQASLTIRALPEQTLELDLTDSIMSRIEAQKVEAQKPMPAVDLQVQPRSVSAAGRQHKSNSTPSWVVVGIAAVFVGLLAIPYALWNNDNNVVVNPPVEPRIDIPVIPLPDLLVDLDDQNTTNTDSVLPEIDNKPIEDNSPRLTTTETNKQPVSVDPKTNKPGISFNMLATKKDPSSVLPTKDPKAVSPGIMAASTPTFSLSQVGGYSNFKKPGEFTQLMQDQLIDIIDTDDDDKISDLESYQAYGTLQKELASPSKDQAKLLNQIDQDDDSILIPNEANSAVAFARYTSTETGKKAGILFNRLDANDDGKWNKQDFKDNLAFLQMSSMKVRTELEQTLLFVDRNHDGDVGFIEAEFAADHMLRVFNKYDGKILDPKTFNKTMQLFNQLDRDKNGRLTSRERARNADLFSDVKIPADKTLNAYELYQQLESDSISL